MANPKPISWAQAVTQPLSLLSEDMQDRRILNGIAASAGVDLQPKVVSNSFLSIIAYLRTGLGCAIAPNIFGFVLGQEGNLVLRKLVNPEGRQLIGVVLAA